MRRVLTFLQATQEADGHWPQNMWLDGAGYWPGIQMDETGFPILLVDAAFWEGAIGQADLERFWPMVRHAARYIVLNGPVTGQDRWEEDGGYSPSRSRSRSRASWSRPTSRSGSATDPMPTSSWRRPIFGTA